MHSRSPLLVVAGAILLIDAGRDLLDRDFWGAGGTLLVVVLVTVALRPSRPPSGK